MRLCTCSCSPSPLVPFSDPSEILESYFRPFKVLILIGQHDTWTDRHSFSSLSVAGSSHSKGYSRSSSLEGAFQRIGNQMFRFPQYSTSLCHLPYHYRTQDQGKAARAQMTLSCLWATFLGAGTGLMILQILQTFPAFHERGLEIRKKKIHLAQ